MTSGYFTKLRFASIEHLISPTGAQYLIESFGLALFPPADSGNAAAAVLHVAVRPMNKVHSLRITTLFACIGRSVSSQFECFLSFDSSTHNDT